MADFVVNAMRQTTAAIATAYVPDVWWGWGIGIAGGYYGKELAVRYTPQLINHLINGSVVEPLVRKRMVSHILPVSASIGAFTGLYVAIVMTNLMLRLFKNILRKPPPGSP